jgi:SAM-dependent methyltransferase
MSIAANQPASAPGAAAMPPPPPSAQIFGMGMAAYVPQMLHVVAKHGIPDLLVDGPRTSADLAAATGLHERSLYRVLRSLAGLGFFTEESRGLFGLTPLGSALTSTDGSGARELMLVVDWWSKVIAEFPRTVETGTSGMELAFDMSLWEFCEKNPAEGEKFDRAVRGAHAGEKEAVAETYDFSAFHQVVDVAGGTGLLLAEVLRRYPQVTGVLFDVPAVVTNSTGELDELRDRCETVAGDFFESVPAEADCYVLSHVIHDWDDERSLEILRNCRDAMDPNGRLLLVEMVIPPGDAPHPGKMLDMVMLTLPGGMERSEDEYRELLDAAGFRLTRVIPTQTPASVIEAVPTNGE